MYLSRSIESALRRVSTFFPVLLVTGPRQVGKTTMLRHLAESGRTYVSLDDPNVMQMAQNDPILFFERFPPPVFIDEIQYAPALLKRIKIMVDEDRSPGRFWLTGSQHFEMMKGVTESLAGRVGILPMLGISMAESKGEGLSAKPFLPVEYALLERREASETYPLMDLYRRIWLGSFPELMDSPDGDWEVFYRSYVRSYLERDVQDYLKIHDQLSFHRFLRAMAARTGQLLNLADLARDADITPNTAKSWLSVLRATGLVFLLEPYHTNVTKRFIKMPKVYFLDTGLCAYLTGWNSPSVLESGSMTGSILETWMFSEILKSYLNAGRDLPGYFYRDRDMKEIDLLLVENGTIYPIEFKKSSQPGADSVRNFTTLNRFDMKLGPGAVMCLAQNPYPITRTVTALPIAYL